MNVDVKETWIEVEPDVRLRAFEMGAGPLVVLLHGFPDGWSVWREQLPALAQAGFRAVAVEQRGYPLSDKPRGIRRYAVSRLAADVNKVIDQVAEDKAASVIGHDWGGGVAWAFAMTHPERLDKLVIINAPHPRRVVQGLRTVRQAARSWYMAPMQISGLPERVLRMPTGAVNWYRALRFGGPAIRRIERPVLVIWGERDPFLGRELAAPSYQDVPNLKVERLAHAGHWPQRDEPDRVNVLIRDFLRAG